MAIIENVPMEQPLIKLLALRKVRISMETVRPDGSGFDIVAEVDASGNSHIMKTFLGKPSSGWPTPAVTEATLPSTIELLIVDGITYISDDKGGYNKTTAPEFAGTLEALLRSPDGPGLWVAILPKDSLTAEGSEQKGGFAAQKYSIRGDIEGVVLTGTLWLDTESGALIGSDLQIPTALYGPHGTDNTGTVTITLDVSKADIAPITAPEEQIARGDISPHGHIWGASPPEGTSWRQLPGAASRPRWSCPVRSPCSFFSAYIKS